MSTTSTDILNFLTSDAASYIEPLVRNKQFGDALDKMKDLFEAQGKAKASASSMLTEGKARAGADPLLFYLEQFESTLQSANRGHTENFDQFLHDARDLNQGVHDRLNKLYDAVTGRTGDQGSRLDAWHAEEFKRLSDTSVLDYTMADYVSQIDEKLAAIFSLVVNGVIILSLTTSGIYSHFIQIYWVIDAKLPVSDSEQAQEWADDWGEKLTALQDAAYNNYPPALKLMIPNSYDADWMPAETDWCFECEHDSSVFLTLWNPSVPFLFPSKEYPRHHKFVKWRFSPPLEEGAVGLKCKSWRACSQGLKSDFWPGKTVERSFSTEDAEFIKQNGKTATFKITPFVNPERPYVAFVKLREVQSDYDVWGTWILSVNED
ncbi:hypothetical protein FRC09_005679 [Ceratobasidium sp. 395]|nr:hypothetical protein FRC09_005679 [Ceratobasidium sp. 395]